VWRAISSFVLQVKGSFMIEYHIMDGDLSFAKHNPSLQCR